MEGTKSTGYLPKFLAEHADFILHVISPLVWMGLFVSNMTAEIVLDTWYMPFLGFAAALLANSVPLGGGIVYIPALSLLGAQISLGSSFTIATMPIGNGIFGFLRWLRKDPTTIIWESFPYTVLPSWIGTFLAISFFPSPNPFYIRFGFGIFCFVLGVIVTLAIYRGGLRYVFFSSEKPSVESATVSAAADAPPLILIDEKDVENEAAKELAEMFEISSPASNRDWSLVIAISFLGGVFLVPHIGIGPALVTYVLLSLLGYSEEQARVTGIITGGWVCILPFVLNALVFDDVPSHLWLMVLPGVFFGA